MSSDDKKKPAPGDAAAPPAGGSPPAADELLPEMPEHEVEDAFAAFSKHHGKKKKKRGLHLPGQEVAELNLTAMMDMMTILLVFLLNSYGNEPDKFTVNDSLRPPESSSKEALKPATIVTVTDASILVDNVEVVKLGEVQIDASGYYINPLVTVLTEKKDYFEKIAEMGGPPFEGTLLVVAHRATKYNILSAVLYSAGRAEFGQYRLVVLKGK